MLCGLCHRTPRESICIRDLQLGWRDKKEFAEFIETSSEHNKCSRVMSRQLVAEQTLSHFGARSSLYQGGKSLSN